MAEMLMKLGSVDLVSAGSMKQFTVKDQELLLVNLAGQFFCLDARCTHAGAPLVEGSLKDEVLTCPWHGSQFRVTDGSVVRGPAEQPLKSYSVKVKDQAVYIEL
jgi:nitrite reductase/ring-hydroxylating ferredoxin subunit